MTATTTTKVGDKLPTASVVRRTPDVKVPGLPSEARRERVQARLKDSVFADDGLD